MRSTGHGSILRYTKDLPRASVTIACETVFIVLLGPFPLLATTLNSVSKSREPMKPKHMVVAAAQKTFE